MKKSCLFIFLTFTSIAYSQKDLPKIIVGIVVDQMCYDYLNRFGANFSQNGFNKIINEGAHLKNMHYNYIPTYTGPGHASIYTGTTPDHHGIIANDWIERKTRTQVNCVGDAAVYGIGGSSLYGQSSPHRLNKKTITDMLKETYPKSKVVSVSIKDRGAILPGGHQSDGSYWFDYNNGTFITSSFYREELPCWLKKFNKKNNARSYAKVWEPLLNSEAYSAEDDSPYERILRGKTKPIFPYDIKNLCEISGSLTPFTTSPFANTLLTDLALRAIKKEKLGKGTSPDMLCISYSSPDIAGHAFGPDSREIEDMYIRLDLELSRLLNTLESSYGKSNILLFLTADHGVVPVPQKLIDDGKKGGYVFIDQLINELRKKSINAYGVDFILGQDNLNIYLDYQKIKTSGIEKEDILNFIALNIKGKKGIKQSARGKQLENLETDDGLLKMLSKGFYPTRSGDLLLILEHGYLPKTSLSVEPFKGTSHGSGYAYDTHVPCLWYGMGIEKIEVTRRLAITDISTTLSQILKLKKGPETGTEIKELITAE